MPSFILRDLDPDLWRRVQARAASDAPDVNPSYTIKGLLLKALRDYAARKDPE